MVSLTQVLQHLMKNIFQLNLENVLFIEDRIYAMLDKLKKSNHNDEQGTIIELCEDWWEMLR